MTNSNDYIMFGLPHIEEDEIQEVVKTLRSGWLGTGPKTAEFEQQIAQFVGAKHGLALNSCTAGLHLSLLACGIGPGDEVITTPLTFSATVNSIIHSGATPIFVDVDLDTANIDPGKIESVITPRTRAIMPVHMYGRPCEMDEIHDIAKRHNLFVIEDAAHALGAEYKGRKIGSLSDLTCFSFYVTKNITTGEGGMITTNNTPFAKKIKVSALHGLSKNAWQRYSNRGYDHYEVLLPGFKYNMTDMEASLGLHQMRRIEQNDRRRQEIWDLYNESFKDLPVTTPAPIPSDIKHARHLYTILVDEERSGLDRDAFRQALHERGIGTGVHFLPVHSHKFYAEKFGLAPGDFPNTEYIGTRTVSIPLSTKLTDGEVSRIVLAVRDTIKQGALHV